MKTYLVTSHNSMIIKADSKAEALEYYYEHTDGTEIEETVKLIRKKRGKR